MWLENIKKAAESFKKAFEMFKSFVTAALLAMDEMSFDVGPVEKKSFITYSKDKKSLTKGKRFKSLKERSNRRKAKLKAKRKRRCMR